MKVKLVRRYSVHRTLLPVTAMSLLALACSSEASVAAPELPARDVPAALASCNQPPDSSAEQLCLEEIEAYLDSSTLGAAAGDIVTHEDFLLALDFVEPLTDAVDTNFEFGYESESPGSEDPDATTPLVTRWTVGGASMLLSTCFEGTSVTFTTDDCA